RGNPRARAGPLPPGRFPGRKAPLMDVELAPAIYYLVKAVAFLTALALTLRARPRLVPLALVAGAAGVLLCGLLAQLLPALGTNPALGFDYRFFWKAGLDVWAGQDPYAPGRFA